MQHKPFICLLALFVSLGCSGRAETEINGPDPADRVPVPLHFSATSDTPVKTTLGSDFSIHWQSWDKITVFSGTDGDGAEFTVSSLDNDNKKAVFTGLGLPAVDHFAVSPAQSDARISGGVITAVLPMQQGVLDGSFGAQANLSVAKSNGESDEFFFRNVGGILSVQVSNAGITGIRLQSLGGEKLSGEASISFDGDIPVAAPTAAAHNWVSLSGAASEGGKYYFAVFPGTFSEGFRITLYKGGKYFSLVSSAPLKLERNGNVFLGTLPAVADGKWKSPGTVVIRGEAAEDGQEMSFAGDQYADMNTSRNRGTQIEAFASDEYNYEAFTSLKAGQKLYFQDGGQMYGVFSGTVVPISSAAEAPAAPVSSDGVYRIRLNLPFGKAYFQEVSSVEFTRCGNDNTTLSYAGNGVWTVSGLRLNGSEDRYKFHFTIDGRTQVYGRMYDTDRRPGQEGLNPVPDTYYYLQPAVMNTWEPSFKFPDAYRSEGAGRYYADLKVIMNASVPHYTHSLYNFVDGENLPALGTAETLSIQGAAAIEAGQLFRYSASFSSGSGYGDEDGLGWPDGYDYEIFTRLAKSTKFHFATADGHKFAVNAAGTAVEAIASPGSAAYAGVSQDGVYRIRINSSNGAVTLQRAESANFVQHTYKNQSLTYVGNGVWEGSMLDLYWKPKPEWGANRQWQFKFQIYFNQQGKWQYYGRLTDSAVQPQTGFWDGLFSVENDPQWNIYTTEDLYIFTVRLQLNADGYTYSFSDPVLKAEMPAYTALSVTSSEETFTMHRSADGSVFEGVSTFTSGATVNMVATDALGRKHQLSTVSDVDGVAYLEADPSSGNYTFTALPSLLAEGNAVNGFSASSGCSLAYAGHGVFRGSNLNFTGSAEGNADAMTPTYPYSRNGRARFAFVKPGANYTPMFRRLDGSRKAIECSSHGSTSEMQINPGIYDITVDLRSFTFDIRPAHNADRRITVMGSSVPTGTGATDEKGYMYLFGTNALTGGWTLSNRSVPGNNTVTLTERYDDLVMDGGRYVIYALSLGNEGIHGAADQDAVYKQWKTNMKSLVSRARNEGRKVVVVGNYGRGDFDASDYAKVKAINLEIAQWNVPSVNVLGAVDDEAGHWPSGYQNGSDTYHPNDAGHAEMSCTIVPSLLDAMEAGKAMPGRDATGTIDLTSGSVSFTPEATVHPFTVAFYVKTTGNGNILHIGGEGLDKNYSASGLGINDGQWHLVAVTHYYAQGVTRVYIDGVEYSNSSERIIADSFYISGGTFRELFFWRSAMNADEISALAAGKMLNSSLEIYAPFIGGALTNTAVSNNHLN
ncbi:MAG: hypothetical protein J5737_00260 [Bacteroidales bacterium]|nr:hypothetical protein [Bacteroidales bacterium]